MTDVVLTILAILFELGVPALCAVLFFKRPDLQKHVVVILGAVTPALLFYLAVIAVYLAAPGDKSNAWAAAAMWFMSLPVYGVAVAIGIAFCFSPHPRTLLARFLFSMAALPIALALASIAMFGIS